MFHLEGEAQSSGTDCLTSAFFHKLHGHNQRNQFVFELLQQEKNLLIIFRVQGGKRSANLRILGNGQGKLDDRGGWVGFEGRRRTFGFLSLLW